MELNRLTPVTLVVNAASRWGAARAKDMARRSTGGLLLADNDEAALAAIADDLDLQNLAPERVSTLAFDAADIDRWEQASGFISAQYGRLDWALVYAAEAPAPELVDFGRRDDGLDFAGLALSVRAIASLMRKNVQGGAIVVAAPGGALNARLSDVADAEFVHFVAAAADNAGANIRINGMIVGALDAPAWARAPQLADLSDETGGLRPAFERLAADHGSVLRCDATPIARLVNALLSDECPLTGAVLGVDAEHAM